MGTESPKPVNGLPARARSRRWRVFAATFACFLLILAAAGLGLTYWIRAHVKLSLEDEITRNLTEKAQLVANRINSDRSHSIEVITSQEGQAAGARATVIDTNGQVVADSQVAVSSLQNEGRSPEFAAALRGAAGTEKRNHNGAEVLFVAVPVSGGAVRLAYPMADISSVIEQLSERILWGSALCAVAGLLSCGMLALFIPLD